MVEESDGGTGAASAGDGLAPAATRPESGPQAAVVLAIDPGLAKCGIAVVAREPGQQRCRALHREVAPTERLVARVLSLLAAHPEVTAVLIGNATNGARLSRALREALADRGLPLHAVEEAFTSQRARVRFQQENPPRGLSRLVPAGLRSPPCPYDDYVAILLAEDWFGSQATGPG